MLGCLSKIPDSDTCNKFRHKDMGNIQTACLIPSIDDNTDKKDSVVILPVNKVQITLPVKKSLYKKSLYKKMSV